MRGRVLVVEEDPEVASELEGGLQVHGYTVACLNDGQSGLVRAITDRFDCIILSAELPGMGGLRVCNRIKKDPTARTVPLLMMGSSPAELETHRALETKADRYLHKPVRLSDLLECVRTLVDRAHVPAGAAADALASAIRERDAGHAEVLGRVLAEVEASASAAAREREQRDADHAIELERKDLELEARIETEIDRVRAEAAAERRAALAAADDALARSRAENESIQRVLATAHERLDAARGPELEAAVERAVAAERDVHAAELVANQRWTADVKIDLERAATAAERAHAELAARETALNEERLAHAESHARHSREVEELTQAITAAELHAKREIATAWEARTKDLDDQERAHEEARAAIERARADDAARHARTLAQVERLHEGELAGVLARLESAAVVASAEQTQALDALRVEHALEHTQALEQLRIDEDARHAEAIAELAARHAKEIAAADEKLESATRAAQQTLAGERAAFGVDLAARDREARLELDAAARAEQEKHAAVVEQLERRRADELAEHARALDALREEHARDRTQALEQLRVDEDARHAEEIAELAARHAKEIAAADEKLESAARAAQQALEGERAAFAVDLAARDREARLELDAAARAEQEKHAAVVEELERRHADELATRDARLAEELASHARALESFEAAEEAERNELSQRHAEQIAGLRRESEEAVAALESRLRQLEIAHADELSRARETAARAATESELASTEALALLRAKMDGAATQAKYALEAERLVHAAEIVAREAAFTGEREAHASALEAARAALAEKEALVERALEEIRGSHRAALATAAAEARATHAEAIAALHRAREEDRAELVRRHEGESSRLRATLDVLEEDRARQEQASAEASRRAGAEMAALLAAHEVAERDAEQKLADTVRSHAELIERRERADAEEKERVAGAHSAAAEEARARHAAEKSTIESERDEARAQAARLGGELSAAIARHEQQSQDVERAALVARTATEDAASEKTRRADEGRIHARRAEELRVLRGELDMQRDADTRCKVLEADLRSALERERALSASMGELTAARDADINRIRSELTAVRDADISRTRGELTAVHDADISRIRGELEQLRVAAEKAEEALRAAQAEAARLAAARAEAESANEAELARLRASAVRDAATIAELQAKGAPGEAHAEEHDIVAHEEDVTTTHDVRTFVGSGADTLPPSTVADPERGVPTMPPSTSRDAETEVVDLRRYLPRERALAKQLAALAESQAFPAQEDEMTVRTQREIARTATEERDPDLTKEREQRDHAKTSPPQKPGS